MKYIVSTFNQDYEWVKKYTKDYIIYNRGDEHIEGTIHVQPNIGTDLADKFRWIIENYEKLPTVVALVKANLFKYISEEEFEKVKNSKVFTPLLTKKHRTYSDNDGVVCFYDEDGMYNERNDYWYLREIPTKTVHSAQEIKALFKMDERKFNAFAPGSSYIVPRENILKHSKEYYQKLLDYVCMTQYGGEAQLIERNLYYIWS
jgi:UDP-N-acetylglucosamine 2-epimerase